MKGNTPHCLVLASHSNDSTDCKPMGDALLFYVHMLYTAHYIYELDQNFFNVFDMPDFEN